MKLNQASVGKGAVMPQNHLSYSGIVALLSSLVLAACSSAPTPEECKIAQVRAENRRIYGENYPEEIDLHELARQVVFLEQKREELLFENHLLHERGRLRTQYAERYHLLPVDIAYYRTFALEGDVIHITSIDHPELPTFSFCTRGPGSWGDFDRNYFYYEALPIFLPEGEYRVEVFNQGVLRFASSKPIYVTPTSSRRTICGPNGKRITVCPPHSTIYLLTKGYWTE